MKSPFTHLIFSIIACVAALTGYGFWYTVIAAKSIAVTVLQNQIDAKTEMVNRLSTARTTLAELTSDETAIQSYFIPETGVVAFIDDIEARGHSLGTTVNVLSVSTGGAAQQPTISFTLSIKGSFDAVMRTVGAIEYAPYALSIGMLSIGQDPKNGWRADLTLHVGSLPASTAVTQSDSSALGIHTL